jgi:hypothetical protein
MARTRVSSLPIGKFFFGALLFVRSVVMAFDAVLVAVSGGLWFYCLSRDLPGVYIMAGVCCLSFLNFLALWQSSPSAKAQAEK